MSRRALAMLALVGASVGSLAGTAGCGASPRMLHQSEAYYEHCHAADLDPTRSTEERIACWTAWVEHYREGMPPERVLHARRRLAGLEDGIAPAPLPDVTPAFSATFLALEAAPPAEGAVEAAAAEGTAPGVETGSSAADSPTTATTGSATTGADATGSGATGAVATGSGDASESPTREATRSPADTPAEAAAPTGAAPERRRPPRPRPMAPRASSPTHPCTAVCLPRWNACVDRADGRGLDGLEACRIEHRVCLQGCM